MSAYFCATCEGYSPVDATLREVCGCVCIVSWFYSSKWLTWLNLRITRTKHGISCRLKFILHQYVISRLTIPKDIQVLCQVMMELSLNCIVFTTRVNQNGISYL